MRQPAQRPAPDVDSLRGDRQDQPGDQERTRWERGQVVVDQLGPEAFEQDRAGR